MPRSRSRSKERRRRSRSGDKAGRSKDKRSRSRDYKRKDESHSRDRNHKRDRHDRRERDKSRDRSKRRDRSPERTKKREVSREHRREKSTSRIRIIRRTPEKRTKPGSSKTDSIQLPNDESSSSSSSRKVDLRTAFEISNEFSREGFEQFTRDHGIDFTNIDTEEDRNAVHEKMEDVLKAHFAAQGKIYPPPKVEKPAINAATGFANDGSFMEQFKKMQDDYKAQLEAEKKRKAAEERLKSLPIRRRGGGKILKTGIVAKTKLNEDGSEVPAADPWSSYLKEVQKYKNASCDSDAQTRPLVK